ncbi:MAG: DUF4080 domain-containing protein [Candidatus Electrothrix sp. GW3-4]|uniref:B12-binding domain-containing radical SAM protein n=1 Tax=Candidatus Electrothrix sp. GW3-4 TaxID=3126740 RepID=UPI0030CAB1B5
MLHLVSLNCRYSHSCLALFYLRNALEQHLPEQPLLFSQFTINDPYYGTLLRISRERTKAVFFSVYIWNHSFVYRLINDLARLRPGLSIILGGPEAQALGELPEQCTLFLGELEGAPAAFYQDLNKGRLQSLYRAERPQSFPSPYRPEDFSGALKNRQLYYESSRGCPFSCSYCLSSGSKGVRHKPVELVKEELTALIAADPMIIKLVDRTFNDHPERALTIWQFLIKSAQQVRFHFEIAPDRFTEAMFALLATVPCDQFQFEIGIQSCHEPTLSAVKRKMDLAAACRNIQRLLALDTIHLHVDLILGLPFETKTSFRDALNQIFRLAPHYIQLGLLKVLPDTEIAQRAEEFGLIFCSEPPYEVLATRWLDHKQLSDLYELCECIESFYNNRFFRSLWHYLVQSGEEPFAFFAELLRLCREYDFFQLSRTHKLMMQILTALVQEREDKELLLDLLRYDWLRCGHRTLPEYLTKTSQTELRNRLRDALPQNIEDLFTYQTRVEFLKQARFIELSQEAVQFLGLTDQDHRGGALIALLPEQTKGVMRFNKAVVLPSYPY